MTEILGAYIRVRWWLLRSGLRGALYRVRNDDGPFRPILSEAGHDESAQDLAYAVERVLRYAPGDSKGIVRSLVLIGLLDRRGWPARLMLGLDPGPRFESRAWVDCEGRLLLAPRPLSFFCFAEV